MSRILSESRSAVASPRPCDLCGHPRFTLTRRGHLLLCALCTRAVAAVGR